MGIGGDYYLVYKITNDINSKRYIGCHKTKNLDDGYMGSGKILKRAIAKYGVDSFTKEILHVYDNPDDMLRREIELIQSLNPEYNLHPGGNGGWGYINKSRLNVFTGRKKLESNRKHRDNAKRRAEAIERAYNSSPSVCQECSEPLERLKRHNKYCSSSCSAIATNRRRYESGWRLSQESRRKTARTLMQRYSATTTTA